MLDNIKLLLKKGINVLGYNVLSSNLHKILMIHFLLSKLLSSRKVKCIIDGGASIGETSKRFSDIFCNAFVHAIEPYPNFYKCIENVNGINIK